MLASSRFFNKVLPTKKTGTNPVETVQKSGIVDAGGDQDNLFYALATGIADNLLTRPRTNMPVFMQLQAINPHLNNCPRFERIAGKPQVLAEFIRDVAYALRQIAIKELGANAEFYHEEFDVVDMQQPGSRMPACSIDAVAKVLNIPVVIKKTEAGKGLHKLQHCGSDTDLAPFDKIVLRSQENYYFTQVVQVKALEEAAAAQTSLPPVSWPVQEEPGPSRQAMRQVIRHDTEAFLAEVERNVYRLTAMVETGEIDKQTLLQIYIENLRFSPSSRKQVKRADIEHGSQRLFEEARRTVNRPIQVTDVVNIGHDQQVEKELINALARGISLGEMDENKVYTPIEQAGAVRKPARVM